MPANLSETDIFTAFSDLSSHVCKYPFLDQKVMDVAEPIEEFAFFADKIRDTAEGVKGLKAKIPFKYKGNQSIRPITRTGYTPDANPIAVSSQEFTLKGIAATAMATYEDILATNGDHCLLADLMTDAMQDIYNAYPRYRRANLWSPASGVLGKVASISTTTVTLDNASLNFSYSGDTTKLLWPSMYLAVYSSANALKGIVQVISIDADNDQFTIDADTSPTGIADNDLLYFSDIAGAETGYNNSSTGILEMIDNDNTFQGMDRSTAANWWARAQVVGNSGTGQLPTFTRLKQFFRKCYQPEYAVTDYRLIDYYWENNLATKVRFQQGGESMPFIDGYSYVQINKTKLVEDADCPQDKVIVPDLKNCAFYTKGQFENPRNEGWIRVPKRPFFEMLLMMYGLLGAKDCRYMGRRDDFDITAAS